MYSFWLVPETSLKSKLQHIIQQLAHKYDAVEFDPHVTLYAGPSNDSEVQKISREVASRFSNIPLCLESLKYTNKYTKTLFVQFQDSEPARDMWKAVKESSAQSSDYELNPHLSLLYKAMPAAAQAELCQTVDVPKGIYVFNALRVIETENPLTEPEQIKRWRTVIECPLRNRA